MMAFLTCSERDQLAQHLALGPIVGRGAVAEALRDGADDGGGPRHLDAHGVLEEGVDQPLDLCRHGGGEEQGLPARGKQLADALDVRDEPHVEHAVGLVDDQDLHPGQQDLAAPEVIEQPARRGDQHVDAAVEFLELVVERYAADQQGQRELVVDPVFLEALRDLGGKLAGRRQDQRAGHARPRASALEPGQHRQHEAGGLAGPRLGDAEHVAARHGDGDGLDLDWGRLGIAGGLDGGLHFCAEPKLSERCGLQKKISPSASSMRRRSRDTLRRDIGNQSAGDEPQRA